MIMPSLTRAESTARDIDSIESIERRMPPQLPVIDHDQPLAKIPTITELIQALIPADKPFSVTDMMHWLHDAHNGQKFQSDRAHACIEVMQPGLYSSSLQDGAPGNALRAD